MGSIMLRGAAVVTAAAAAVLGSALLTGGGASAVGLPGIAGTGPAASGRTWGKAEEVPGTAALNKGGTAEIYSVSCAAAGNCSAGGTYTDASDHSQAFVVNEVKGSWRKAEEVAGSTGLNKGGTAAITSVSCAPGGNCSAGGSYKDASDHDQAFVVSELKGRWGKAEKVPGTAALNTDGYAGITSVSCAAAGSCGAGGYYTDGSGHEQAFVVSEVKGRWGKAEEVPGTAALNKGAEAEVKSVSCAPAGSCGAGGYYTDGSDHDQVFVVSEVKGRWGKAEEVPGSAGLSKGGESWIYSVSCASAGNCGAGGYYLTPTASDSQQAFVVSEVKGRWGKAEEVPGTAALNADGGAWISSVSCASAGDCGAGGYYDASAGGQAFVVSEVKGRWGKAEEVPGTAALNKDGSGGISSVSCASAGNCSGAGSYRDAAGHFQVFVVSEVKGRWGKAQEVPGTAALNKGGQAGITSVSCAPAGSCSAGGYYDDSSGDQQAFVVTEVR
jgi:D-alanine-D-alanine ligase-like ATP-grasp enzyme